MPTSPTEHRPLQTGAGFTLLEIMVALFVASLLAVIALPSAQRMNDTMRYRDAVRELVTAVRTARRDAFATGRPYDLLVLTEEPAWALVPSDRAIEVANGDLTPEPLPEELTFEAVYAAEVSPGPGIASIRFYPSGGASGGDIEVLRAPGNGVRIKVDWLLAEALQVPVSSP